jgi:hypothetical protein
MVSTLMLLRTLQERPPLPMPKVPRGDGYSLLYRIGWEVEYTLMHVFGPATQDGDKDPRVAMKKDHDRRKQLWLERKAAEEQSSPR